MPRVCLLLLLLIPAVLFAQGTISVDATTAMHVCSDKNPAASGPCAIPPRPLNKVSPTYPEKARQARREGSVVLGITVAKDGSTHDIHVVKSPDDELSQAAITAVSQWKFEPGTYEGNPVAVEMSIEVNFRLDGNASPPRAQTGNGSQAQVRNLFTDASEAYNRRDYQTAANLARRITALAPQDGSGWNQLGIALLELNQLDAAVEALEMSVKVDTASTFAYNNLGRVYWKQHKFEDAAAQFRKQIVINPNDHYAHGNFAMMLRDQKKCSEAMPELEKALAITPNKPELLLAQGQCDIDLGSLAKGLSELEQATSASSAPGTWNSAAYSLAKRNIELDRAEKWSETSLSMESARMHSVSLDHLTLDQLNYVYWIAHYWDTRGWIYFLRGDSARAQAYIEPSWWLLPLPVIGDHLAQIYEKTGQPENAVRTSAMAVASADRPTRSNIDPYEVAEAKQRLAKLAGPNANIDNLIARGRTDLAAMAVISIPNRAKSSGSADFTLRVAADKPLQVRQISGDASLAKFEGALQSVHFPVRIPEGAAVEIPLRGTLSCQPSESQCPFTLLTSETAVDLARKEAAIDSPSAADASAADPHIYDSPSMGMRISLPDEWKMVKEEPGSFSRPHNALFSKTGSMAYFMLTREHLEGTSDLYKKMLESFLSKHQDYKSNGEESVKRDGLDGARWIASWNQNGVAYHSVMEFFTVGDDHYRLTSLAPKEVYDRYAESFESMFRSVRFPMLHTDPRVLEGFQ
jgi:TonB family protein